MCRRLVFGWGQTVSIRGVPCGTRPLSATKTAQPKTFQSARPVWDATVTSITFIESMLMFQSARPVWDATEVRADFLGAGNVSIRASRVGRDGG